MKKRVIIIIILLSILLDVQRVSAAETPKLHTVTGEKIINVMDEKNIHVFIDLKEV